MLAISKIGIRRRILVSFSKNLTVPQNISGEIPHAVVTKGFIARFSSDAVNKIENKPKGFLDSLFVVESNRASESFKSRWLMTIPAFGKLLRFQLLTFFSTDNYF